METKRALSVSGFGLSLVTALAACKGPMDRDADMVLRDQLISEYRARMVTVTDAAGGKPGGTLQTQREPSDVEAELSDQRRQELDKMSGSAAYAHDPLPLGRDLEGQRLVVEIEAQKQRVQKELEEARAANDAQRVEALTAQLEALDRELAQRAAAVVELSLRDAVRTAVTHNLDLQIARITPAVSRQQIIQAQAVFDATVFSDLSWGKLDTPQPPGAIAGLSGDQQTETFELTTGITKPLTTGGSVTLSDTIARNEQNPTFFTVNSYYDNDLTLSATQPLLRGAGVDINTAEISLAENTRARDLQTLRQSLLDVALNVEQAYWNLDFSIQNLLILERLYQRTVDDRDRLIKRREFDVSPVRITEANSFVELRRSDVIRARQQVRNASDTLKRLINDPNLPVAGETLILPTQDPGEAAIEFSLLDSVTTALQQRPELQSALLQINDASIRQRVADNARLPLLNVGGSMAYNGLDVDQPDDAFANSFDGDYVDYLLSANFEYPLGNRSAKALYEQRRLERQQTVLAYRNAAQAVVIEVKTAMRNVMTAYELIGATRAARRAAADSLRAIEEQERAGVALTPEFLLDLKLQTQQRLADAEAQEAGAIADYNNAIAELYRTTGTLLEYNGITFDER